MNLSVTDRALLTLVRSGLWECEVDNPSALCLSTDQWAEVFRRAKSQTVQGLLWQALDRLDDELLMPAGPLLGELAVQIDRLEKDSEKMLKEVKAIFQEMEAEGLHPVLQKGLAVASLYERPKLRACGDIDIYLLAEEYKRAVPKDAKKTSDGGVLYERNGIDVELHSQLLDIDAPGAKKVVDELIGSEGFEKEKFWTTTSPLLTLLLLDAHILKHAMGWGIGLRQLCDYARARRVLKYDESAFRAACEQLGIAKWTETLDSFCENFLYMGSRATADELVEELLDKVLRGGNFGKEFRDSVSPVKTARALQKGFDFSRKVAPKEAIWHFISLIKGRLRR